MSLPRALFLVQRSKSFSYNRYSPRAPLLRTSHKHYSIYTLSKGSPSIWSALFADIGRGVLTDMVCLFNPSMQIYLLAYSDPEC